MMLKAFKWFRFSSKIWAPFNYNSNFFVIVLLTLSVSDYYSECSNNTRNYPPLCYFISFLDASSDLDKTKAPPLNIAAEMSIMSKFRIGKVIWWQ